MKVTSETIENLTRNACFAADNAAMGEIANGATQAQVIRRAVRRTIEFLIGNDLVEVKSDGAGQWLTINPPYEFGPDADSAP